MNFNAASCGPSNPLRELSKHQQQDRSLQHSVAQSSHQQNVFSNNMSRDFNLEQQFHQHQQNHQLDTPRYGLTHFNLSQQQLQQGAPMVATQEDWLGQFSRMNVVDKNEFSQEYKNYYKQYERASGAQTSVPSFQSMYTPVQSFQRPMHTQTQVEPVFDSTAMDQEFANLEQELNQTPSYTINKEFQEAATNIMDSLKEKQESNSKFAQSSFLKLMRQVSEGEVSLNDSETEMQSSSGHTVGPSYEVIEDQTIQQQINEQQVNEEIVKHNLGDPLDFVSVEGLEKGPYLSGQEITNKSEHRPYSWDEHYDDYRNDDTSF